jgi:hypothetical protein
MTTKIISRERSVNGTPMAAARPKPEAIDIRTVSMVAVPSAMRLWRQGGPPRQRAMYTKIILIAAAMKPVEPATLRVISSLMERTAPPETVMEGYSRALASELASARNSFSHCSTLNTTSSGEAPKMRLSSLTTLRV